LAIGDRVAVQSNLFAATASFAFAAGSLCLKGELLGVATRRWLCRKGFGSRPPGWCGFQGGHLQYFRGLDPRGQHGMHMLTDRAKVRQATGS